jgi:hypothetical protein
LYFSVFVPGKVPASVVEVLTVSLVQFENAVRLDFVHPCTEFLPTGEIYKCS